MLKVTVLVCRLRYSNRAEQTTVYVSDDAFLLPAGWASTVAAVASFQTNIQIIDLEHMKCCKPKQCVLQHAPRGESGRVACASLERTQNAPVHSNIHLTSVLLADLLISNGHFALTHWETGLHAAVARRIAPPPQEKRFKKEVHFIFIPTPPLLLSPDQEFRGFCCVKDTGRVL